MQRFVDSNGNALSGGLLFTYQSGTTTKFQTYTDSTGNTQNTNPIVLNQRGEASVWLVPTQSYKFVLAPANDTDPPTSPIWTEDNILAPSPVAVGNMTDEKGSGGQPGFVAGVDFIAGTSTTLTLSNNYGSPSNIWVSFDGVEQGPDTYSIGGTNNETLTFTSPIPTGTNKVYVKGGTSLTVGGPSPGTVTDSSVAANAGIQSSKLSYFQGSSGAVARTVQSRLQDWASAKDFGAKGDGVTDDSAALQAWLNALGPTIAGLLPAGTYICRNLTYGSNITIFSEGATLKLPGTAAASDYIMLNSNFGSGAGVYGTSNVQFLGALTFDGNNTAGGTNSPFSAIKVQNLYMENVAFQNYPYIGAAFGGCNNVTLKGVYTTNCGKPAQSTEGGASVWLGPYTSDGTLSSQFTIRDFVASSNHWSALYANANHLLLDGFRFTNNKESSIFANSTANFLTICNGIIDTATVMNISAEGIEIGASNVTISNVNITNTDSSAIALTDVFNCTISNVVTSNCVRNPTKFPATGHIVIISDGASPTQGISISNHRAWDGSSPAYCAVQFGSSNGATAQSVSLNGNNYSGTVWGAGAGKAITSTSSGAWDVNSAFTNNTGYNPQGSLSSAPAIPNGVSVTNPFPFPVMITIAGGTVQGVSIGGFSTGLINGTFIVGVGQSIVVSYTSAPNFYWFGQ